MTIRKRIERLEEKRAAGRIVVWHRWRGDPEPEHGPDDVLLVVVREGEEGSNGLPEQTG